MDLQQDTCQMLKYLLNAAGIMLHRTCYVPHAAYNRQHTTCYMPHAPSNARMRHTLLSDMRSRSTCNMLPAICNLQHATCNVHYTVCILREVHARSNTRSDVRDGNMMSMEPSSRCQTDWPNFGETVKARCKKRLKCPSKGQTGAKSSPKWPNWISLPLSWHIESALVAFTILSLDWPCKWRFSLFWHL